MNEKDTSKIILSILFGLFIAVIIAIDAANGTLASIAGYKTLSEASDSILENNQLKNIFLEINGIFSNHVDVKGYYNDIGIYITDDYYMYSSSAETSTDYETEQTVELKKYLDEKSIDLIYVNQPTKYLDDSEFTENFGVLSYNNRNADKFLQRISEAGVNTVDLREYIKNEGLDIKDLFYGTDHHWTTRTGFWAAEKIAESLNTYAGYNIDLSIYDINKYKIRTWENCWIGEQGQKAYKSGMPRDSFTNISPDFDTSFYFKELNTNGDFSNFYNESVYDTDYPFSVISSWHYSYGLFDVVNRKADHGKILMVCDSYANVCEPFLALSVNSIDCVILRNTDESLRDIIEKGDYDTVLVCYAQFMIGAHDDPDSANYRMFRFD